MPSYSKLIKEKLMASKKNLEQRKDQFVKHPGKDFKRKRKHSFQILITLMLSMGGKSLENELLEFLTTTLILFHHLRLFKNETNFYPKPLKSCFTDSTTVWSMSIYCC